MAGFGALYVGLGHPHFYCWVRDILGFGLEIQIREGPETQRGLKTSTRQSISTAFLHYRIIGIIQEKTENNMATTV